MAFESTVKPDCRRARANSGGARNAKHDDGRRAAALRRGGVGQRPLEVAEDDVAGERGAHPAEVRPRRWRAGWASIPSIVSPTAAIVTVPCGASAVGGGGVVGVVVVEGVDVPGRVPAPECDSPPDRDETPAAAATPATTTSARASAASAILRWRRPRRRAEPRPSCAPKSSNGHLSSPTVTLEQRILDEVAAGREELVELTSALIGFDTTAREPDDPARAEADLQAYLGERLGRAGAAVDIWEPDPRRRRRDAPDPPTAWRFDGRPQLAARFAGAGGGPSLLLNGHIDVVPSEPRERWTSDPNRGRGARRQAVRARRVRHEGRRRVHGVRDRGALAAGREARRRPDREHRHRRGVVGRRRPGRRAARRPRRRRHRAGADRVRGLGGVPRLAHADDHRRGPARARRDGAAALARRRRGERDREDGRRAGRRTRACARSGDGRPDKQHPHLLAGDDRARQDLRAASGRSPTRRRARSRAR